MANLLTRTIDRLRTRPSALARAVDTTPAFVLFDGKNFKSFKNTQSADFFSGYGMTAAILRPGKLTQTDEDYARAYIQCEYAFRCVEMVSSDIASLKHGVRNKQTKADMPDHTLMKALSWAQRVNGQDILSLWQKALYIFGENFLLPIGNGYVYPDTNKPFYNGLQWLNPLVTEPYIIGGELRDYRYSAYGVEIFRPDQILYDRVASIFDDLRGQSRMSAALSAVNIDIEIKRYTLESFLKDMRMQGILTGRDGSGLSQTDVDAALAKIKDKKEARLIALAPALVWQQVQHEWDDTQFKASDDARRRITTALGIPMSVVGAWDDAHYQSAPAQLAFYYDHVVFRECDRITQYMNEVVLPLFDPEGVGEWYYDRDSVMTLIEDKATKSSMYTAEWTGGGRSFNEYREAIGLQAFEGGDLWQIGGQLYSKAALQTIASQSTPPLLPDSVPAPAAPALAQPAAVQAVEPTEVPGMKSACLMLTFPHNPDLISLQSRVKELVGQGACEWLEPDEYHVTLAYMPVITDEQLAMLTSALPEIDVPDMDLRIGSLGVFDNVGEQAIHFKIRRNADLYDLQSELHDTAEMMGIPLSSYSKPENYKPHITMGYAADKISGITFKSKLKVTPAHFCLKCGDETIYQKALGVEAPPPEDDPPLEPEAKALEAMASDPAIQAAIVRDEPQTIEAAALNELAAWQKKVKNKGAAKAVDFKTYLIRDEIAHDIRMTLKADMSDEFIRETFDKAKARLSYKAIDDTRSAYVDEIKAAIQDGIDRVVTKASTAARVRGVVTRFGKLAYTDGLEAGGVSADDLSEDDTLKINDLNVADSTYVSNLVDEIYSESGLSGTAENRALKWQSTLDAFYYAGLASADGNGMYRFDGDGGKESCFTCKRLEGQIHRLKDWERKQLRPGVDHDNFECGTFRPNCSHDLVRVAGKASGNW